MQVTDHSRGEPDGIVRRLGPYSTKTVPYAIAAKLMLLLLLALNTRFVMDEFVQLGQAKYLGHGFFETIWPVKAVGYTIFYELAHLIGWNARSVLLIGRLQTAVLGYAVVAMIYGCARALKATRGQALLVVLVLLSFSNFIERIFRTRSEPLAVFFAVAALLVVLRGPSPTVRRIVEAGALSGLAFVTTQKSIYFNFALALGLFVDAVYMRRFALGVKRCVWLVLGSTIPIIAYCLIFGGTDPLPIAQNLFFGPLDLVVVVPKAYSGLRVYVWQTLSRNALLYLLCFLAMAIEISRVRRASSPRRIALVFSVIITVLIFTHNQPWPYVFVMALPFIALWIPVLLEKASENSRHFLLLGAALTIAIAFSFTRNVAYFRVGNSDQLKLVARAERLLGLNERYFDGVGMLPNRREPSMLWLDHPLVLETLRERQRSEAYRIFSETPPKLIIWSYRMDAIEPVVGPLVRASYVHVAPNIWMAGRRLSNEQSESFRAPVSGAYRLYDGTGSPVPGKLEIDGKAVAQPFHLTSGLHSVTLLECPQGALLLPEGAYSGRLLVADDNPDLFAHVYD